MEDTHASSATGTMNSTAGLLNSTHRNPVDAWISERFIKRECVVIIPTSRDSKKCGCGRYLAQHYYFEEENDCVKDGVTVKWSITRCTTTLPTDAYGTLTFHGVLGQNKARYMRLDFSSDPLDIWHLLVDVWGLEPPKLVITVHGGGNDFDLSPSILRAFKKGLLKAARTTSAWIITSGIRLGVVKHVASALSEVSGRNKLKHVNLIGFAPWGLVRRSDDLIGINENFPYYPTAAATSSSAVSVNAASAPGPKSSRYVSLCEGHTGFLLVDNGTSGRPGAEAFLRRRFEDFLRQQPLLSAGGSHYGSTAGNGRLMPMVCLVVNGGRSAIHSVMSYVSTSPPVPVVVCSGTGRAADLITFAYRNMNEADGELDANVRQRLSEQIRRTLGVGEAEASRLLKSVALSVRRRQLLTIYGTSGATPSAKSAQQPNESPIDDTTDVGHQRTHHTSGSHPRSHLAPDGPPSGASDAASEDDLQARIMSGHEDELDFAMLNALLKGQNMSPVDKLNLLLTWNREDMAREIFEKGGHDWPAGSLDQAMMNALIYDRVDFVRLLLSHGMEMDRFLTIGRMEELYNSDKGPSNTLRFVLQDVVKDVGPSYKYKLPHVGLIIDKLMGFGFRSNYCRQEFRKRYKTQQLQRRASTKDPPSNANNNPNLYNSADDSTIRNENMKLRRRLNTLTSTVSMGKAVQHFPYPFHDLFLWAVLTNRQEMALCFWQHGEELLARALIAYRLYRSLAKEAEEDYLEVEICQQLKKNANEFKTLAYELLEQCYLSDDDLTLQLLTYELRQWSKRNCISLAALANYKKFVAHQCCQMLLADLWLGGLRIRKNANLKVVVGVVLPPSILALQFKSKEELLLQAQTAEEFEENRHIAKGGNANSTSSAAGGNSTATSSSSSSSSSTEMEASDDDDEPRIVTGGNKKHRRGEKHRNHNHDHLREEESGGVLHPVSDKQHQEAHQRTVAQRFERRFPATGVQNQRVDFRLSDRFSPVCEIAPAIPDVSPTGDESSPAATAASSPDVGLSARPSLALGVAGSPSSYRYAVAGVGAASSAVGGGGADSGKEDSQRCLLLQQQLSTTEGHDDEKTVRHLTTASSATQVVGSRFSPAVNFKHRTPTFAMGTSRKLQSMVALKKAAASLEVPKLSPIKQHQQLSMKKKMQEFYSAPIATFWAFTMGYLIFLSAFTYIVLVRTPLEPSWPEYYVMGFIFTFAIDHGRMILIQEPKHFLSKLKVFCHHLWDVCTLLACFMFFLAVFFRVSPETMSIGRVMYCVNIVFWYMRMLHLLTVSSKLGPFINMYGKMVLKMVLLINILFVVLASFGVFRQSITEPNRDWSWELLRNIVYKPYFMLYGELYAEEIDKCGDEGSRTSNVTGIEVELNCVPGFWLTPLFMTVYLLLSIVVFLNMMIAAFNYVFLEVNSQAQEIWKFQRYEQVIEYEQQPFMPPPFVILAHTYWLGKYLYRRLWKKQKSYRFEHSLKLFLSSAEISKLHDFERECLEEMMAKKREHKAASTDERLRYMADRMEYLALRLDDLHDRTNSNLFTLMMLEQKVGGGGGGAGGPINVLTAMQQQRSLPSQASLPLSARYGAPTTHLSVTQQQIPSVSMTVPSKSQGDFLNLDTDRRFSADVRRLSSDAVALSPSSVQEALVASASTDDLGVRMNIDRDFDQGGVSKSKKMRPPPDRRKASGPAGNKQQQHQMFLGAESPTNSLSRQDSFSRTHTWASGLGDVISCDDLTRMDYGELVGETSKPIEFMSGAEGDDEEEKK